MYRTIDTAFWTDPKVRKLSWASRTLLLYLITNPHTHVSGIYYLPVVIASHETGLEEIRYRKGIDTLSSAGFCCYDGDREIVWVKNMMRYQGKGEKNHRSAAYHLMEDLHNSPLILAFLETYPEVGKHVPDTLLIRYRSGIDTRLSDRVSTFGPPDPDPDPDPDPEQDAVENTVSRFGEFQHVALTAEQYEKLKTKLSGSFDDYVRDFDRWVEEAPTAKSSGVMRKKRNAYLSILAWHDRDVKQGKARTSPPRPAIVDEQDAQREAWARMSAKVNH